jgi:hypothetical protein
MESNIHSLKEVLTSLRDSGVLAITARNQLAMEGTILLTVYSNDEYTIDEEIAEIETVLIKGCPAQLEFEQSYSGITTNYSTLVYLQADTTTLRIDDCEVSAKALDTGLEELRHLYLDFADERAYEEKQIALNDTGEKVDKALLKKCAESKNPLEVFESPFGDIVIDIYTIDRYEYALFFDGGVYEAYKCSKISPTMSEQLRNSTYWHRSKLKTSRIAPAK